MFSCGARGHIPENVDIKSTKDLQDHNCCSTATFVQKLALSLQDVVTLTCTLHTYHIRISTICVISRLDYMNMSWPSVSSGGEEGGRWAETSSFNISV